MQSDQQEIEIAIRAVFEDSDDVDEIVEFGLQIPPFALPEREAGNFSEIILGFLYEPTPPPEVAPVRGRDGGQGATRGIMTRGARRGSFLRGRPLGVRGGASCVRGGASRRRGGASRGRGATRGRTYKMPFRRRK